jgi:hypothetical protein
MMALIVPIVQWVAHTHLSAYLRNIWWVWPLCETIHFIGLAMVVGVAGFFDLRLLGFFNRVPISACREFMPWAMVGFALNLASGLVFLTIFPAQYAYSQTWWFKVFFLFIAGANALIFETTMGARMVALQPGEVSPVAFKTIGALSLVSWFFVLYFGRMLPFLGAAY